MKPMPLFEIKNLTVEIEDKEVLKDFNLCIQPGEVHALMGRNGSGKTTLSNTIMGHPSYKIKKGSILLLGQDITDLPPDERARKRIFLAFQHPIAVPGVTVANFLRSSIRAVRADEVPPREVRKLIRKEIDALGISESFMTRYLNEGFSGGEKKRLETLQLKLLDPKLAILDETDSGLDVDALKIVADRIESIRNQERGILLITHYQRMLDYIKPDHVHILMNGKIVTSGDSNLALRIEKEGFDWIEKEVFA